MFKPPLFAVTTPFDQKGHIDEKAFIASLRFLADKGVPGLIVGGTTGEFPSLTLAERNALFHLARAHFSGTLIQNISSPSYREARALAEAAQGADGFLLLPPYYYAGIKDDGIVAFYAAVLDGLQTPTLLYHFPKHSKVPFTPALVRRLREACPNIVGLKDSGGDFELSKEFHALGKGFQLFTAASAVMLRTLQEGMAGLITGSGVPLPEYVVGLTRAVRANRQDQAVALQAAFDRWALFRRELGANGEAVAKYALSLRVPGYPAAMRPPLPELTPAQQQKVQAFLAKAEADLAAMDLPA